MGKVIWITTVGNFRHWNIAARRHREPPVPAFRTAIFSVPDINRIVLDLGGIGSITILPRNTDV
jgi:anhydro-N-acetylmuramic acid kinase